MTEVAEIEEQPRDLSDASSHSFSQAQLKYSFDTIMNLTFFNFLLFPAALIFWKAKAGFRSDLDEAFWIVSTFWHTSWWGIFLVLFLSIPASTIGLGLVPWILSVILVWPLGLASYSY